MTKTLSDRAQKAADTRAKNAELAQREAEQLASETKDGQGAKKKALENPVWKAKPNKGQLDNDLGQEQKKRKRKHKRADDKEEDGVEEGIVDEHVKKQRKSRRPPSAAIIPTDESELDDESVSAPRKTYRTKMKDDSSDMNMIDVVTPVRKQKGAKSLLQGSASESSGNGSDEDSDSKSSSKSNLSLSTDDSKDSVINDKELKNELPRFVGAGNVEAKGLSATRCAVAADKLFDVTDDDVDMLSRPVSHMSSRSARSRTAPPTTDFDTDDESDPKERANDLRQSKKQAETETSEGNEDIAPSRKRSAPKPGRRAQAFAAERPSIKTSSTFEAMHRTEGKVNATEDRWPLGARLVLPASGKPSDLGLRDQHPVIQSIVRKAIQKVTDEMVLKEAWPEAKERPLYEKTILLDACRQVIEDCGDSDRHDVKAVKQRVKTDAAFAKALANVAIDRLSTQRAPAKREASKHIPYYKLGLGSECKERVESLFLHHSYIFPGVWGSGEHDGNLWKPKRQEPYLNMAIVETLKAAFFSKPSSLGNQYLNKFHSTLPDAPDEHELSISLVALGATGVYAGLYEFISGFRSELTFSGNTFIRAYAAHVTSLNKLKQQKPTKFHEVMSTLYKLVVSTSQDIGGSSNDGNDIFSIIDL